MKNPIGIFFLLFFYINIVSGQESQFIKPEAKGLVYNKEFTVDFRPHTNGFAIAANWGKIKKYYLTRFYQIEIGHVKHPKETKTNFDYPTWTNGTSSSAFIFGKQNSFFTVRAAWGEKRYFSEKANKRGVAIGMSYAGGPSLGILKPYYLEIIRFRDNLSNAFLVSESYSDSNADVFLDITRIYGASSFSKGLNEIKPVPGIHIKTALHFDWGAFDEFVKAIEVGVMGDFYLQKVPIMVSEENQSFFVQLYLTLQLGKRR